MEYILPFMTREQDDKGQYLGYCFFFDTMPDFLTTRPTGGCVVPLPDYDNEFGLDPIRVFVHAVSMNEIKQDACVLWDYSDHVSAIVGDDDRFSIPRELAISTPGPLDQYVDFISDYITDIVGIDIEQHRYIQNPEVERYQSFLVRTLDEVSA